MWIEDLQPGKSWASLWSDYFLCGCGGIRTSTGECPACKEPIPDYTPMKFLKPDGTEIEVHSAVPGAEGRYEDWVYLQLMEREWHRPFKESDVNDPFATSSRQPAQKLAIALIFWSYFETRVERLLRVGMRNLPAALAEDTLKRYQGIGSRIDRVYKLIFGTTYFKDLESLGFQDVSDLLKDVGVRRNAFSHGDPFAIDHDLVYKIVENLKREHESWIAVFNKRIAVPETHL